MQIEVPSDIVLKSGTTERKMRLEDCRSHGEIAAYLKTYLMLKKEGLP